jgi:hypothetical protein
MAGHLTTSGKSPLKKVAANNPRKARRQLYRDFRIDRQDGDPRHFEDDKRPEGHLREPEVSPEPGCGQPTRRREHQEGLHRVSVHLDQVHHEPNCEGVSRRVQGTET